jgi:hypothetical protein
MISYPELRKKKQLVVERLKTPKERKVLVMKETAERN